MAKKRRALEYFSSVRPTSAPPAVAPPSTAPLVMTAAVPFTRDDVVAVHGSDGVTTFAKVLRDGPEGLLLMGMRQVEGPFYSVDPRTVSLHQDFSMLQFVDAVWDREKGFYEVRSGAVGVLE